MKVKILTLSRLSILLATTVFSAGLLLNGCSNDKGDTTDSAMDAENNVEDQAAVDSIQSTEEVDELTEDEAEETLENKEVQITDSVDDKDANAINGDPVNPITSATQQQSLVTNPTDTGTPEDTVKKALNTLYYGDVKEAATYYKVDMANFAQELANTQSAFQQTVIAVTLIETKYNADKTKATINGELKLKGQSEPAPLSYELQKINGQWKILG